MMIRDIKKHIADGTMSAREVVDSYISRISVRDSDIGAFVEVYEGDARLAADAIDSAKKSGDPLGALAGVPVAIKDNISHVGKSVSAGSHVLEGHVSTYNATVVDALQDAGAIIIGRTNMDEFACGSSTETSVHGVTKNPIDVERVPGGSSGGSAAAVAAEMVPVALGSDTGGSVRQPASLCGVYGFKPTYGAVSRYGLLAMASSLDQIGPLATSVEDLAEIVRVISGNDTKDLTSHSFDKSFPEFGPMDVKGLRIGVPVQFMSDALDSEVSKCVSDSLKKYGSAGAEIIELDIPLLDAALAMYYIVMPAEVSSNLNRYDGLQYGRVTPAQSIAERVLATRRDGFGDEVKRRILTGTFVLSSGYVDAYYKQAVNARYALRNEMDKAFQTVDLIMGPTSPTVAWKIGEKFDDPITMYLSDIYTVIANLAGIPALSVPCGMAKGLPVGLQIMGARGKDSSVLDAGYWLEKNL